MDTTPEGAPTEWESGLLDVSEISLDDLISAEDSPLAASLRRVAAERADPDEPIAGFNSAL